MTVDFALHLASAAARVLAPEGGTVLIGKDTRLSGYMFESALEAGFVAAGVNVDADRSAADAGHRVHDARASSATSASSSAPRTISTTTTASSSSTRTARSCPTSSKSASRRSSTQPPVTRTSRSLGRATRVDKSRTHYQEFCASTLPPGLDLAGMKIVIDCANGAAYKVGAAHARGSRRRDRADRLLAERPQHQ